MTGFHTALSATINSPRNHALPFARGTITQCVDANQGGLHDVDMLFYCTVSWKMEGHHMKPLSIMQVNRVLLYATKDRLHQTLPVTCSLRFSILYSIVTMKPGQKLVQDRWCMHAYFTAASFRRFAVNSPSPARNSRTGKGKETPVYEAVWIFFRTPSLKVLK